ncbi:MAG: family 43 glycosylhydrolase [Prevotella sp.]|nr:family 43 glycosylhydrolase [Prevotella sp.]
MKKTLIFLLLSVAVSSFSQTYTNPVLKGVADAGVIRYAGRYYLGGVATYGDFFVSDDLVNWDNRIHVFDLDNQWTHGTGAKNNQVHADDISYSGGLFHLLFSVNYWGKDRHIVHITHATSTSIEGPYREVREDQWFENRIDPQVFCDEDGRLYLYMVKFTDGNTIWARPMNADFTFSGDAVQQFSSQQGTWETMDNRVAEGPFVIKYHGRYYMMYNANHTAADYGNYRLGISEATSPMGFNPGNKYPYPVVSPQTDFVEDNYVDLIRYGATGYNAVDLTKDTINFEVNRPISHSLYLKIAQRGGIGISINGHEVALDQQSDYKLLPVDKSWIHQGDNQILVTRTPQPERRSLSTEAARNRRFSRLVALALYDMDIDMQGDMLLTPGQPNIVRGPNGWEWWLVYMANQGFRRDQYIDRIHFVNDRFTVDGITGHNTSRPYAPAKPQYSGSTLCDLPFSDSYLLEATARKKGTDEPMKVWRVEKNHDLVTVWCDNVLVADHSASLPNLEEIIRAEADGYDIEYFSYNDGWDEYGTHFSGWSGLHPTAEGLPLKGEVLKGDAASDYEFTASFDSRAASSGRYGLYAAYVDAKNYVRTTIDAARQMLVTEHCVKGKTTVEEAPLAYTAVHYPDLKYTDSFEKQYRFDSDTYVSDLYLPHLDADNDTYARSLGLSEAAHRSYNDDMAGRFHIDYLDGDTWRKLDYTIAESSHPAWQRITFPAVRTQALRLINADPEEHSRLVYRVKTTRQFEQINQIRVEKRGADVRIFVGNREMATVTMKKAVPARVGLYASEGAEATLVSDLYYPVY